MSEPPESPATPGADEPAALVPDGATAVHSTGGEPTITKPAPPVWTPPAPPQDTSGAAAVPADRAEVAVGAAFAGGLVLALILKRLAR